MARNPSALRQTFRTTGSAYADQGLAISPQERIFNFMRSSSQVADNRPDSQDPGEFGQVLHFPRRRPEPSSHPRTETRAGTETEPENDFARYEQEQDEETNYRHRMLMNVIAIGIVTVLVTSGVWIADTIAAMQKAQDCAMQGRGNCAPIEIPTLNRSK
jgi:hypothetical protein